MALRFEWDEDKAASNLRKHSVTFDEASTVFADPLAVIFDDEEHSLDEIREIVIGHSVLQRLLLVSFTERGHDLARIIMLGKQRKGSEGTMKKASTRKTARGSGNEMREEYRFDYSKAKPNRFALSRGQESAGRGVGPGRCGSVHVARSREQGPALLLDRCHADDGATLGPQTPSNSVRAGRVTAELRPSGASFPFVSSVSPASGATTVLATVEPCSQPDRAALLTLPRHRPAGPGGAMFPWDSVSPVARRGGRQPAGAAILV